MLIPVLEPAVVPPPHLLVPSLVGASDTPLFGRTPNKVNKADDRQGHENKTHYHHGDGNERLHSRAHCGQDTRVVQLGESLIDEVGGVVFFDDHDREASVLHLTAEAVVEVVMRGGHNESISCLPHIFHHVLGAVCVVLDDSNPDHCDVVTYHSAVAWNGRDVRAPILAACGLVQIPYQFTDVAILGLRELEVVVTVEFC